MGERRGGYEVGCGFGPRASFAVGLAAAEHEECGWVGARELGAAFHVLHPCGFLALLEALDRGPSGVGGPDAVRGGEDKVCEVRLRGGRGDGEGYVCVCVGGCGVGGIGAEDAVGFEGEEEEEG